MSLKRINFVIFLMFFFSIVGGLSILYGANIQLPVFNTDLSSIILPTTQLYLLLIFCLFFYSNKNYSKSFIFLCLQVFFFGFFIEVFGVNTGLVFGEYSYGKTLGLKLFNTPLVMGINWLNLSLASFGIISFFTENKFLLILLSSLLMVSLDYIIEPIAINLDFWSWQNVSVPIHNYFGWFFGAIIAQMLIVFSKQKINFKIAIGVLGSQLIFFFIQYLNYGNIS